MPSGEENVFQKKKKKTQTKQDEHQIWRNLTRKKRIMYIFMLKIS